MEAPKLPSIFKNRRPNQFEFRPRYYDPLKEKHQKLEEEHAGKGTSRVKDFRTHWQNHRRYSNQQGRIARLAVILAALFLAAWWLLFAG